MATIARNNTTVSTVKKAAAKTSAKSVATTRTNPIHCASNNKELAAAITPARTRSRTVRKTDIDPERRRRHVEVAAYYIAERRGFQDGHQAEDWMTAEREIDCLLAAGNLDTR